MKDNYQIKDLALAPQGQQKIDWVAKWMSVLNRLYNKYSETNVFKNKRVALCIHLEAKTAYLALTIKKLGADVWITGSNPLSTKDDVAAALTRNGIHVFAKHSANQKEYQSFLQSIVENKPHVVVDDGGDVCELLHSNPEYGKNLKGICEETTTGVVRLKELAKNKQLLYPAIAINDAKSKYLFDNRYGTGQSAWTAIMHLTNMNIAGKVVVVIGYGWVGKGIAQRAKGLGAEVIVTEIDPWKALEARMDGFGVKPLLEAVSLGDLFVTTTGLSNVVRKEHFKIMKSGAFLANAGHFDYEINVPELRKMAKSCQPVREEIEEFALPEKKKLYLLARGGIINIAGGLGHPVEIMDLSFSVQLGCVYHLLASPKLEPTVYPVPVEIDEMVVREKLAADGIKIDSR
ncbi:adenosylhomocysteinase [candidate division KSB1 bacterium]|nr:adenosylhomocysteinase [candidate division KSB1 bacterium]